MKTEQTTWCVAGQEQDGPWELLVDGLASEKAAREWLRGNHREYPECCAFYIDREDNEEGIAESYFDRIPDGSLAEYLGSQCVAFAD